MKWKKDAETKILSGWVSGSMILTFIGKHVIGGIYICTAAANVGMYGRLKTEPQGRVANVWLSQCY